MRINALNGSVVAPIVLAIIGLSACRPAFSDLNIEIVRGYEGMARYAKAAVGKDLEQRAILYDRFVDKPYRDSCFRDVEGYSQSRLRLTTPIQDVAALAASTRAIVEHDIESRIIEAIRRSAGLLPATDITVCLFSYSPDGEDANFVRDRMEGVMGFSEAYGVFWIETIPADGWLARVPYTAAHEYHHAVSFFDKDHPRQGQESLLTTIITEGRADSFAERLYPGLAPLWTSKLTEQQERRVWGEMQPLLDSTNEDVVFEYVFGSERSGIPETAGYTIGYRIVQSFLVNNPDMTPSEWSSIEPQRFLESSGYVRGESD